MAGINLISNTQPVKKNNDNFLSTKVLATFAVAGGISNGINDLYQQGKTLVKPSTKQPMIDHIRNIINSSSADKIKLLDDYLRKIQLEDFNARFQKNKININWKAVGIKAAKSAIGWGVFFLAWDGIIRLIKEKKDSAKKD